MSNHYHAVVYDPNGCVPAFIEHFHKMLAKTFNARWGRRENFWSTEETCVTLLAQDEDVFDAVVYTLANPVAADLVEHASEWPGCSSWDLMGAGTTEVTRPEDFFSRRGVMPEKVELEVINPPLSGLQDAAEWIGRVKSAVAGVEHDARAKRLRAGGRVLGVTAILNQEHTQSPRTPAGRSKLRPNLACKDRDTRIAKLQEIGTFRLEYRTARIEFAKGDRMVRFPNGTYRLRLLAGVACEPLPVAA
jgi:hypothetical protein